jgi:hypothetical protein
MYYFATSLGIFAMLFNTIVKTVLLLCVLLVGQEAAADDWSLSRDRDGIAVYTKTMQIDDGSEQLAYRGVASFNVSMSKLISAMRDVEHFDQWLHNCYEPRLLDQIAPETRMVYQKARTPWPTAHRDLVLTQTLDIQSPDYAVLHMKSDAEYIPAVDGLVRVPYFDGFFAFRQIDEKTIEVTYEAVMNSGGAIPAVIGNLFIVDVPFESLKGLRAYLAKL